jgi:hypothetical protein
MSLKDIAGIKIEKVKDSNGLYNLAEEISIVSPFMRIAFIETTKYGQMYFKLEFTNIGKDQYMNKFYSYVHTIEKIFFNKLCYLLKLDDCQLSSQIYKKANSKYDPILTLKVPKDKKKKYICAKIVNSDRRTFYDIQRNEVVRVKITAKYIWTNKKKMTLRWNIKELEFRDTDKEDDAENK